MLDNPLHENIAILISEGKTEKEIVLALGIPKTNFGTVRSDVGLWGMIMDRAREIRDENNPDEEVVDPSDIKLPDPGPLPQWAKGYPGMETSWEVYKASFKAHEFSACRLILFDMLKSCGKYGLDQGGAVIDPLLVQVIKEAAEAVVDQFKLLGRPIRVEKGD